MTVSPDARWAGRIALERAYVSSLLAGAQLDGVGPSHFVHPDHRQIVSVINRMRETGAPVDLVLVADALRLEGQCASGKDWAAVIADIATSDGAADNLPEYGRRILTYAKVEELRSELGQSIAEIDAPGGTFDPSFIFDRLNQRLLPFLRTVSNRHHLSPVPSSEILAAAAEPIEWTVKPLLTSRGVRILSGPGKVTKSTFLLAACVRATTGGSLAGHFEADGGHRVAWFDAENSKKSWSKKFVAVCRGLGVDPQELLDSGRFSYFHSCGLYLDQPSTLAAVIDAIKRVKATESVFDSLTRIHRQKEADAVAMSSFFVDSIFRVRDEADVGVSIAHHTRKGGQRGFFDDPGDSMRGTGDLRNVCDTHLALTRNLKTGIFTLDVSAQRDNPEGGPYSWRMDWKPDGPATFIPVVQPIESAVKLRRGGRPTKKPRAKQLLKAAIDSDPNLKRAAGIELCRKNDIGETLAKEAWREVIGE